MKSDFFNISLRLWSGTIWYLFCMSVKTLVYASNISSILGAVIPAAARRTTSPASCSVVILCSSTKLLALVKKEKKVLTGRNTRELVELVTKNDGLLSKEEEEELLKVLQETLVKKLNGTLEKKEVDLNAIKENKIVMIESVDDADMDRATVECNNINATLSEPSS